LLVGHGAGQERILVLGIRRQHDREKNKTDKQVSGSDS